MRLYVDEYRFVPLQDALAERLRGFADEFEADAMVRISDFDTRDIELAGLGYLSDYLRYQDGGARARLTSKGKRYFSEFAEYQRRKARYEKEREVEMRDIERRERQHSWRVNWMCCAFGLGGTLLGLLLERALG